MRRGVLCLVILLAFAVPGHPEAYTTGTLVHVDSSQGLRSSVFDLYIRYANNRYYKVHLVTDPSYELEWQINSPIEFRLEKNAIYLKRAHGKDWKFEFQGSTTIVSGKGSSPAVADVVAAAPATSNAPAMPDLPLPSAQRQPLTPSVTLPQSNTVVIASQNTTSMVPRCAELGAMGPQFDLLAKACQFALSPHSLPNFIAEETTHRWVNGRQHDTVTDEVTYVAGRGDRRSNVVLNGQPMASYTGLGGLTTGQLFGRQLRTIFDFQTQSAFAPKPDKRVSSGAAAVYTFRFDSSNNSNYVLDNIYPSLEGTIWVDRQSGQLMRVQTTAIDIPPDARFSSYQSIINYDDVTIPDLGRVLVPTDAEVQMCWRQNLSCSRNVVAFRNYRKFAATVRIVSQPAH